ncbi:MAG TPA: hypothetical protein VE242_03655 [Chthoniobacterales bacterium]|nr:hypothetical protein [Chthoniobacterales bacterium]
MKKLRIPILALTAATLAVFSAQAGDNVWSTKNWSGSSYETKCTDLHLGNGVYRHFIYIKLDGPWRLRLYNITCNGSPGSETYLNLNRISQISSYHYDDGTFGSRWNWDVELQ